MLPILTGAWQARRLNTNNTRLAATATVPLSTIAKDRHDRGNNVLLGASVKEVINGNRIQKRFKNKKKETH